MPSFFGNYFEFNGKMVVYKTSDEKICFSIDGFNIGDAIIATEKLENNEEYKNLKIGEPMEIYNQWHITIKRKVDLNESDED